MEKIQRKTNIVIIVSFFVFLLLLSAILFRIKDDRTEVFYEDGDVDTLCNVDNVFLLEDGKKKEIKVPSEFMKEQPFTIIIPVEKNDKDGDVLAHVRLSYADVRCYVDGKLIYSYITSEDNFKKTGYNPLHAIPLPDDMKSDEIILKCNPDMPGRHVCKLKEVTISSEIMYIRSLFFSYMVDNAFYIVLLLLFLFLNILNLAVNRLSNFDFNMMYISLVCLFMGIYLISKSEIVCIFAENRIQYSFIYMLEFTSLPMMPVPLLLYFRNLVVDKYRKLLNFLVAAAMFNVTIQTALVLFTKMEFVNMIYISHGFILLSLIVMICSVGFVREELMEDRTKITVSLAPLAISFLLGLVGYISGYAIDYEKLLLVGMLAFVIVQLYIMLMQYRISYRRKMENLFYKKIATTDALTNLKNRYCYMKKRDFYEDCREKYDTVGVIVIDMNYLKKINDNMGHRYGDFAIINLAHRIRNCCKKYKIEDIYRVGGDEFVIMIKNPEEVIFKEIIRDIKKINGTYFSAGDREMEFSMAVGCSLFDSQSNNTFANAVVVADLRMYLAKEKMKGNDVDFVNTEEFEILGEEGKQMFFESGKFNR